MVAAAGSAIRLRSKQLVDDVDYNIELLHPNNANKIKIMNFTMTY